MKTIFRNATLLSAGVLLGLSLGVGQGVSASRDPANSLPLEDLRTFTEIFAKIKNDYVEPIDDGELVDVYLPARMDGVAAKRFFRRLVRSHGGEPRQIVTDRLRSFGVAHRESMPDSTIYPN